MATPRQARMDTSDAYSLLMEMIDASQSQGNINFERLTLKMLWNCHKKHFDLFCESLLVLKLFLPKSYIANW